MDTAPWIAQVVLAPAFGTAGTLKVSQPKAKLTPLAATGPAIEQVGRPSSTSDAESLDSSSATAC